MKLKSNGPEEVVGSEGAMLDACFDVIDNNDKVDGRNLLDAWSGYIILHAPFCF